MYIYIYTYTYIYTYVKIAYLATVMYPLCICIPQVGAQASFELAEVKRSALRRPPWSGVLPGRNVEICHGH